MNRYKHPRNPVLLFLGISGLIGLSAYVNVFPPDSLITITGFFLLLIGTVSLLGFYTFRYPRHAMLLAIGIALYLLLRYLRLRQPFYTTLLVASIIAIEYLWKENG